MKVIGAALLIYSAVLSINTSVNFGNIAVFLLGLLMILFSLVKKCRFLRILRVIFFLGLTGILAITAFLTGFGVHDTADYSENAVIVLGAGLRGSSPSRVLSDRLDKAVLYAEENPYSIIVVSGGQGQGEDISEAESMETYLIDKGVDSSRILKEAGSESTYENFLFSKEICDEYFASPDYSTCFITNEFHIYRALQLARKAGFDPRWIHSSTHWYLIPVCYIRECAAVLQLWFLN